MYIAYIQDLHGLEYNEVAQKEFPKKNIKIVAAKSFPLDMQDFTPLLKEAKAANVDAFAGFLYPQNAFPCDRTGHGGWLQPQGLLYDRWTLPGRIS